MSKLSVVLPSRDEKFLIPTIHDIFRNARGEIEVVAVLDSDKWPPDWKAITDQYPNLHTIHHGQSKGMRAAINSGVASAISRGAKFIAKFDAHCSFSEGFDEALKAECDKDWIVVPRRGRLDPENWCETELSKPPIDYHYLGFPDDPNDFGGKGLNGKVWAERAIERAQYQLDEEMSSQGSGWFMHADYFTQLELMDEANYGKFWNEFQELGLKCWLSGGRVMVNKKAKYLHLHKGKKYGRGYRLEESALQQGRNHTMLWPWNEAWSKQTLPFKWLIEHFWPVPSWPENWEEILYATRKPRVVGPSVHITLDMPNTAKFMRDNPDFDMGQILSGKPRPSLVIHKAYYGPLGAPVPFREHSIDVTEKIRECIHDGSLDVVVNNSTLTPGQNPYRGKKKVLLLTYTIDGGEERTIERVEKDWLTIGPREPDKFGQAFADFGKSLLDLRKTAREIGSQETAQLVSKRDGREDDVRPVGSVRVLGAQAIPGASEGKIRLPNPPTTAAALNDYLIRKFQISDRRLRGPMPIELRDFHRNDLAQLFAELGFKRGAEIGVAEGHYSEVLLKANPECQLILVDPWTKYSDNPQNKPNDKHEFTYNETVRRTKDYPHVDIRQAYSMDAVDGILYGELDFCYIDGNHSFDFVMQDLIEWSKRVRSGGIVSGDDYYALDEKRWGAGPVEAVQAYVKAHRIPIWFICDADRSVDFFWVKA